MNLADVLFAIFALIALGGSIALLICRHPITAAVNLVGVMLSLAGIYGLLDASFLAVVQILVYAGAIMMLIVFVLMVLGGARDRSLPRGGRVRLLIGILAALTLALTLVGLLPADMQVNQFAAGAASIGQRLFDLDAAGPGYYILFELLALLLLTAMVAAIQLAKRELDSPEAVVVDDEEGSHE